MAQEFKFQDPGEGIHEAEVREINVDTGDQVTEGDTLLTVETDKAATDIPAPFSGTVEDIRIQVGDVVQVGDVLLTYTSEAGEEKPQREAEDTEDKGEPEAPEKDKKEKKKKEEKEEKEKKGREPEKTRKKPQAEEAQEESLQRGTAAPKDRPVPAAPATRRLARELGVDLHAVEPSGPEGRVLAEDVKAHAEGETPEQAPAEEKAAPEKPRRPEEAPALPDFSQWGEVERRPLRSIRRTTARQMALAWSRIPHVMHQDKADITELERFRRKQASTIEDRGGKLTLTVLIMKALVATLKQYPRFNASLDAENEELIIKHYYHIGVAVDTEQGLLVPVIRDVDRKSITELALELTTLSERTRQGEARREEMQGGTITVTNPGSIGGTVFTPIIRYPEVAILGLAQTRLEQIVQGDLDDHQLVTRLCLPLCLAFDHRANDGADAARFVRTLINLLGDPESFLLAV